MQVLDMSRSLAWNTHAVPDGVRQYSGTLLTADLLTLVRSTNKNNKIKCER